jgi:hypothetical protein
MAESSPIQFEVPNRAGEVVQITGRSANVNKRRVSAWVIDRDEVDDWRIGDG